MPIGIKYFTEPMTPAERHAIREEDKLWRAMEDRIATLERALWVALDGIEVVVNDDTPSKVEIVERDDGGRLVRRTR